MKYKVGDKVRVIKATSGCMGAEGSIGVVTDKKSTDGLLDYRAGFNIELKNGKIWRIGFESVCEPVEDELTAEEATKILSEICCENELCGGCPISEAKGKMTCQSFRRDKTEEVLEILKRWKKDHEKKEVETEITLCVLIIEADTHTLKHEEKVETYIKSVDAKKAEILKKYCLEHDGKYYAISECRCVVKE
ncbi:hypothetical protein [Mediterraneibacter faecis]|uniref:hypothetical protein n=1 Tax=Mediterraneibacter faecis TaxID=592978 RepID=UPI003F9E2FBE